MYFLRTLRMNFSSRTITFYCFVLYCIVLYCIVLYCIVLYCIVLYCIVLYCIVLYCFVLFCFVLYCTVLYCTVLYCTVLYCTVLYCTVLYCTVLYCIVLYCIVFWVLKTGVAVKLEVACLIHCAIPCSGDFLLLPGLPLNIGNTCSLSTPERYVTWCAQSTCLPDSILYCVEHISRRYIFPFYNENKYEYNYYHLTSVLVTMFFLLRSFLLRCSCHVSRGLTTSGFDLIILLLFKCYPGLASNRLLPRPMEKTCQWLAETIRKYLPRAL